jgi:hypothetical protein
MCECGYVFDALAAKAFAPKQRAAGPADNDLDGETPEDQRHFHTHKLTLGWFSVIGAGVLLVFCVILLVLSARLSIIGIVASIGWLVRGVSQIGKARVALRALAAHDASIPRARVVKR